MSLSAQSQSQSHSAGLESHTEIDSQSTTRSSLRVLLSPRYYLSLRKQEATEELGTITEDGTETSGQPVRKKQIGVVSASFLIFNRILGTGVFSTPGVIMQLTGSAGLSMILWLVGTFIAMSGAAVYLEFGTAIPKNGGEKNYLEYVYTKPKFLMTALYASYAMLLGWCSSNSVVFGEYALHAAHVQVGRWNQRAVGLACVTAAFIIQSVSVRWGLRIANVLGTLKFGIILTIIIGGGMALTGRLTIDERPDNLAHPFRDSTPTAYGVLGETRNPEKTLKIASCIGVSLAGTFYMLINVAYFAAVPRREILASAEIIAASFFKNVFGARAETLLCAFVALSAFGTVQAILFAQGRIVQGLGQQGVLPYSRFFASTKPFNSPAAGLGEHYVISTGGLLHIYCFPSRYPTWAPSIKASWPVAVFFLLSNIYLTISPFIPPASKEQNVYDKLPYYLHCVVAFAMFALGLLYWAVWAVIMPRLGGYELQTEEVVAADGSARTVVVRRTRKG
ncbi:hypothetical protein KEM55_008955 [Ascosphaera atra]|nr:hypothetical protein KEM55_008955 [Ascosphaera atra]